MPDIKLIVAAHKNYIMPDDVMYLPLQVGAFGKDPIEAEDRTGSRITFGRDDEGENISDKNPLYSELTAVYWAWKNLDADYIGLAHYRRHFRGKGRAASGEVADRLNMALKGEEAARLLAEHDMIVPAKRKYYIETLYSHYEHTHNRRHLDMAAELVDRMYPSVYSEYLRRVYGRTWGYMYNMFIMSKSDLNEYCEFLFPVLFEMEKRLTEDGSLDKLSAFEKRLFGRVSEILFDVWLEKKMDEGTRVAEVRCFYTEKENILKKGMAFLEAKFIGRKYDSSF